MMQRLAPSMLCMLAIVVLTGCEAENILEDKLADEKEEAVSSSATSSGSGEESKDSGTPAAASTGGALSLGSVTWLHTNVSGWPQTANLSSVKISGDAITLNYDKYKSWPGVNTAGAFVNANPWVFVNLNGKWYAGTWEWMRHGTKTKSKAAVDGSHIKKSPLSNWHPKSGEVYGFMVSGLGRTSTRNVGERCNIVMVKWP